VQVERQAPFLVVLELRPDLAPRLVQNFLLLCAGAGPGGRGYRGSHLFRSQPGASVQGGDFENNDGTGGHSALGTRYIQAERIPLPDCRGAIRMRGTERGQDGQCKVGSQFLIWVGDIEYKTYRHTLVFGR
jgi:cyclophilin family peptidyl-prolyl cis-trans isomerase